MGMVLRFTARTPRSAPPAGEGDRAQARILLFTGVRYERERAAGETKDAHGPEHTRKGRAER